MIIEKKGDFLKAREKILAHQVNCKGVMGAGVAKLIRDQLLSKEQYGRYEERCHALGSDLLGATWYMPVTGKRLVCHMFGENIPTGKGLDTDYEALSKSLKDLKKTAAAYGCDVAIPGYLGCGLAGGDWDKVYTEMLLPIFRGEGPSIHIYYISDSIKRLWTEFGLIPVDPETEELETAWHGFPAGTHRFEIWHYFEDTFGLSVAQDLMGVDR
uniref:Appr-1-p processing protein n=1 Tax=Lachnoclostridium phocaeense TaxID=1871021 RepID=UPI0026DC8E1F|nr:Appr-1-p processing protein [Lachnoclostridium phocaeense]